MVRKTKESEDLAEADEELEVDVKEERIDPSEENKEQVDKDIEKHVKAREAEERAYEKNLKRVAEANKEFETPETDAVLKEQKSRAKNVGQFLPKGKRDKAQQKLETQQKESRRLLAEAKKAAALEQQRLIQQQAQNKIDDELRLRDEEIIRQREEKLELEKKLAESLVNKSIIKKKELEAEEKIVAKQEKEELKLEKESKSERQRSLERQIEISKREEEVAVKSKDATEVRKILRERTELEDALQKEISTPKTKDEFVPVYDDKGVLLNPPSDEVSEIGLTKRERDLQKVEQAEKLKDKQLIEARALRNDKLVANLERDKLELERKGIKLRKEIRLEAKEEERSKKLGKLEAKEEKLRLKKNIVQLRAQKAQNARIIQQKRRELLEKNLAFATTRGAIRGVNRYVESQKQRETPDSILIGDRETGESREVVIDGGIAEPEPEFDLIKSLAGDDFANQSDPINKKIKLL